MTGDEFVRRPGERSWMSEMYGYAYGAAAAGVWHRKMDYTHSLLPGYAALCARAVPVRSMQNACHHVLTLLHNEAPCMHAGI